MWLKVLSSRNGLQKNHAWRVALTVRGEAGSFATPVPEKTALFHYSHTPELLSGSAGCVRLDFR
jgi:hypothetical protein